MNETNDNRPVGFVPVPDAVVANVGTRAAGQLGEGLGHEVPNSCHLFAEELVTLLQLAMGAR